MKHNMIQKKIVMGVSCLLASSTASMAGGFEAKLRDAFSEGMANAGSGVIDSPMASFINPASMILNRCHHAAIQATGVFPNTKFKGRGSNTLLPQLPPFFHKHGRTRNAAENVVVPSGAYVMKTSERTRIGLAITAPYGLGFKYGDHSITQYFATHAKMQTLNITPSVAFRVNDVITFGAGFQAQWVDVKLYRKALLGTLPPPTLLGLPIPTPITGTAKAKADDWTYGWTAGVLFQPHQVWNIGFSYRSNMVANTDGHLKTRTQSPSFAAGVKGKFKAHAKVHFPHVFTLSGSLQVNPCWTLYMDVIRTLWSSTQNITIRYKVAGVKQFDKTPQHWRNTWFISGGFNYIANERWSFRGGLGYEKTPTKDSTRVPALPDNNKHWLACGATYTMGKFSTTLSYGHEFFKKAKINLSDLPQHKGTLKGHIKTHIDMVSLQFNYRF